MSEYYVTSNTICRGNSPQARTLVIKADYFVTDSSNGNFNFFNRDNESAGKHVLVAFVNPRDVLAITEKDSFQADWVDDIYDGEEDDTTDDDTCLECRFKEFLDSEEFFSEVWDIVHAYHTEDDPGSGEQSGLVQPVTSVISNVEHWKDQSGIDKYGFHTPDGFVDFSRKVYAVDGRTQYINGERGWGYAKNLQYWTRVMETIQ